jgi:hypothetical protein
MANFRITLLNLLYGTAIFFAIATLQKSGGALALNVPSEIKEKKRKNCYLLYSEPL